MPRAADPSRPRSPRRPPHATRGTPTARVAMSLCLVAVAVILPGGAAGRQRAIASSDLVHVIEADGRSHVLQHTLAVQDATLVLRLPGSVVPGRVLFIGPERERWSADHAARPERVSIGSGGVMVRYRHQYGNEVVDAGDGRFTLVARSVPEALDVVPGASGRAPAFEAVSTWVFPSDVEVEAWRVRGGRGGDEVAPIGSPGTWGFEDNVLTWSQDGLAPVTLEIEYRSTGAAIDVEAGAGAGASAGVDIVPGTVPDSDAEGAFLADADTSGPTAGPITDQDTDSDGVPDVRDVCPGIPGDPDAALGEPSAGIEALGCRSVGPLVLRGVGFPVGRTRLDLPARRTLDRLAAAMKANAGDWEVAAHTDGVGPGPRNLALSLRRAESVRHYLMLRGVDPNRLVAKGYGEAEPIADEATASGRAANRRVELRPAGADSGSAGRGATENPPDGND